MKCSALEVYVIAVYKGIRGIYNVKPWVKALRLFQSVAAALLQRFLSIRQNTLMALSSARNSAIHSTAPH